LGRPDVGLRGLGEMTIASLSFLLFALAAIVICQTAACLSWRPARDFVFLAFNIGFLWTFAAGGWVGFLPMAGFVLAGYAAVVLLRANRSRALFLLLLILPLALFFWLKKYAFVPRALWLTVPYVTIGVSYIFFRILQLVIDAGSGNLGGRFGLVSYLNYTLNFTTLVSGPIQRHEDFSQNEEHPRPVGWFTGGSAVERIIIGFFKVLVLSALLHEWHKQSLDILAIRSAPADRIVASAEALIGYTIYLYCNFSGYTDIVIGVARFLGFELPENFNRPFSALNFMDFWARWHMSLSNWLKTYVYNPLLKGLMARIPSPGVDPYLGALAFLVTFFLIGVWHGQTWIFVLYGILLGVGVSGNKLYQVWMIKRLGRKEYRSLSAHWAYRTAARGLTFTYFNLSLVCFWAGWPQISDICSRLSWGGAVAVAGLIWLVSAVALEAWERLRALTLAVQIKQQPLVLSRYLRTAWGTALVLITIGMVSLTATPAPDIVYKNF